LLASKRGGLVIVVSVADAILMTEELKKVRGNHLPALDDVVISFVRSPDIVEQYTADKKRSGRPLYLALGHMPT
jgi:hypothetical protein